MGPFASLTASYDLPPGYDEMLEYQLARRLAGPYQRQFSPENAQMAIETLANVKRANYKLSDLPFDPAMTQDRRGGYNIVTGA